MGMVYLKVDESRVPIIERALKRALRPVQFGGDIDGQDTDEALALFVPPRVAAALGGDVSGSVMWAELTGFSGSTYSWKKKVADNAGGFSDASPSVTGTNNAYEANGITGIPSGTIVRLYRNGKNGSLALYAFDCGYGDTGTPATIGSASETETADTGTWARASQGTSRGLTKTVLYRMAYNHSGDKVLYAYYRVETYDANGHLMSISAETRVSIDATEACA